MKEMCITPSKELQELIEIYGKAGLNPQMCDKLIPFYDVCVQAGVPTDPGFICLNNNEWVSQDLAKPNTMMLRVTGESMRDAGVCPGDRIVVEGGTTIRDGDIVVIMIGSDATIKTYMEDEKGLKWLVPHNPDFQPILLTEDMNITSLGKVIQVVKECPRMPYSEIMRIVKKAREEMNLDGKCITDRRVDIVICEMGKVVKNGRQWYAVYRSMVDMGALCEGEYSAFCDKVAKLLPEHGHLPTVGELKRMAVQSFRKRVALWKKGDAPVTGQRFDDYLRIANLTVEKLS